MAHTPATTPCATIFTSCAIGGRSNREEQAFEGADENPRPRDLLLVDSNTCIAIVISQPSAPSPYEASSAMALAAADRRAKKMVRHFGDYCKEKSYRFIPLAMTFGAFHKEAKILHQLSLVTTRTFL
mmetsp:Transcript_3201/g.8335  ORF Transcript_3201/g.8335 Transcript_3201/m.8335 type:complete len:127 (-) Transcript_3201:184-564(-)